MSGLREFLSRGRSSVAEVDRIVFAEVAITNACNLDCVHCSRLSLQTKGKELTKEILFGFLEDFKQQGGSLVCYSGGEPLAKKKTLYPAVENAASLGISPSIISNGLLLSRQSIEELKERGIRAIGISLYGKKEHHDRFVGEDGAYERTVEAIRNVINAGIFCQIMAVPTNESIDDGNFEHILRLGERLGAVVYVNFPTLTGAFKDQEHILLNSDNLERLYQMGNDSLIRKDVMRRGGVRLCPAPREQIYITPYGDVCPCPFIQLSFGNIFEQSLDAISKNFEMSGYADRTYECCPPAENNSFIADIIKPIHESSSVPLYFTKHPRFAAPCEGG